MSPSTPTTDAAPRLPPQWLVVTLLCCIVAPSLWHGASWAWNALGEGGTSVAGVEAGGGLEERLQAGSPWVRWARANYAPQVDRLIKRGNGRLLMGQRKWYFYRQAVDYVTGPPVGTAAARHHPSTAADLGDVRAAILDTQRQLQAAGVHLLVVPVPVKATLHPERLWPGADGRSLPNNVGFQALMDDLRRQGVDVLDLAPMLLDAKDQGLPPFLPRDTHWTPEAMVVAARSVAEHVKGLPLWDDLDDDTVVFDHRLVEFSGRGDLYDMLAYAPRRRNLRPMRFVVDQVVATRQGRGPIDADSPVLLLGDSLSNVFADPSLEMGQRGGFGEHLAAQLGLPVDVIALPGGGASRSRQALALRPQPLHGKRLVVWQFTQRDLLYAAGGWRRITLPVGDDSPPMDGDGEPADGPRRYEVLAWLQTTTSVPDELDYGDCLIASRFRRVDGDFSSIDIHVEVVHWGVRDWQPTAAASLAKDRLYRLVVEPLPDDIDLETTCWLDTIGLRSRPWWVVEVEAQ